MKYAKLINSSLHFAPNPILIDDVWIGNPPCEVRLTDGHESKIDNN